MSTELRSLTWSFRQAGLLIWIWIWILIFPLVQGCLAGAWVAVVGLDTRRTADITFFPFEHSWVTQQVPISARPSASSVRSIAVAPFQGDSVMAPRLAAVLEEWTFLRVVGPSDVIRAQESGSLPGIASKKPDEPLRTLAHAICAETAVDAVFLGEMVDIQTHPSDWGWRRGVQASVFVSDRSPRWGLVER